MKILHISNDFCNSSVYRDLLSELAAIGISQTVATFVYPSQHGASKELNDPPGVKCIILPYRNILQKFFFLTRSVFFFLVLNKKMNVRRFDIVHAHTLFAEGFLAYLGYKFYGVPYVVTIRNTDLNYYYRFRLDLRWVGRLVLKHAKHVIFLSPCYRDQVALKFRHVDLNSSSVIPSGLRAEWLDRGRLLRSFPSRGHPIKFLFVGDASANKNIGALISAINSVEFPAELSLVGATEDDFTARLSVKRQNLSRVKFLGRVEDGRTLRSIYSSHHAFCMASHYETFGLVYLEALAMGLPIVFSEGQGVSGLFDSSVSFGVDSQSVESILRGVKWAADASREKSGADIAASVEGYSWGDLSRRYETLYLAIKEERL